MYSSQVPEPARLRVHRTERHLSGALGDSRRQLRCCVAVHDITRSSNVYAVANDILLSKIKYQEKKKDARAACTPPALLAPSRGWGFTSSGGGVLVNEKPL